MDSRQDLGVAFGFSGTVVILSWNVYKINLKLQDIVMPNSPGRPELMLSGRENMRVFSLSRVREGPTSEKKINKNERSRDEHT